jgi:hypothetical protein
VVFLDLLKIDEDVEQRLIILQNGHEMEQLPTNIYIFINIVLFDTEINKVFNSIISTHS